MECFGIKAEAHRDSFPVNIPHHDASVLLSFLLLFLLSATSFFFSVFPSFFIIIFLSMPRSSRFFFLISDYSQIFSPSVRPSVRPSITHVLKLCQSVVFDQNYYQYERERLLCRVSGFVYRLKFSAFSTSFLSSFLSKLEGPRSCHNQNCLLFFLLTFFFLLRYRFFFLSSVALTLK